VAFEKFVGSKSWDIDEEGHNTTAIIIYNIMKTILHRFLR